MRTEKYRKAVGIICITLGCAGAGKTIRDVRQGQWQEIPPTKTVDAPPNKRKVREKPVSEESPPLPKQQKKRRAGAALHDAAVTRQVAIVNINSANATELETLPGVGKTIAGRIIEVRNKRGGFRRLRGLRRVPGIGFKTFKRLQPFLSL